jgi:hypothetical protein
MKNKIIKEFEDVIDTIGNLFEGGLSNSEFTSKPLFYSLFCALYDLMYGLKGTNTKKVSMKPAIYSKIKVALDNIESIIQAKKGNLSNRKFIESYERHTTALAARKIRHKFLLESINKSLEL